MYYSYVCLTCVSDTYLTFTVPHVCMYTYTYIYTYTVRVKINCTLLKVSIILPTSTISDISSHVLLEQFFLLLLIPVPLHWVSCMIAHKTIKGMGCNLICANWSGLDRKENKSRVCSSLNVCLHLNYLHLWQENHIHRF